MKKVIIVLFIIILLVATTVLLVMRSKDNSKIINMSGEKVEIAENEEETKQDLEEFDQKARDMFVAELEDMINNYEQLSKEGKIDYSIGVDFSTNQFAVCDIDNDGKEELIIKYETASMAGIFLGVFKYNEKDNALDNEVIVAPGATFYENGVIISNWLHNQGPSLSIWPYTAYKYNSQTDSYDIVGQVYSWNKYGGDSGERIDFSIDYDGTRFPDDVDKDKDEVVYMVEEKYVDEVEFNDYEKKLYKDSKEIAIPFVNFTKENIDKLKK